MAGEAEDTAIVCRVLTSQPSGFSVVELELTRHQKPSAFLASPRSAGEGFRSRTPADHHPPSRAVSSCPSSWKAGAAYAQPSALQAYGSCDAYYPKTSSFLSLACERATVSSSSRVTLRRPAR